MKKIFVLIFLCSILTFILFPTVNFVFAAAANCGEYCANKSLGEPVGTSCLCNPLKVSDFQDLLNKIIDFIFWVGITIAPIILIIAGFLYVTSGGDAKRVETAKHMIWYAVIGLLVLLLARGLVAVLKSVIGVQ